ncbi:hypothetical protein BS47DRAFT_1390129 [Hydnum rufescens UP504]|uniref:F-box domain-containing protein n=1 Tax=Hydnum rufescens UP504 TaxID=1448309 RepID=A0A9P6B3K0_9AGAM|nr:hypothetical protein BS47DRAFT_1390129 [Hydnum rufescens UP504]
MAARRVRNESNETTPIYRLPNEMICEIFKHLPKERWARHKFLASISGTSSLWRHVALCTPSLWSTITLYPSCASRSMTKFRTLRAIDMVRIYLERVGSTISIDLWLDFRVPTAILPSDLIVPFLLRNIHRCESLTIQADWCNIPGLLPLSGYLHSLRNLKFRMEGLSTSTQTTPHLLHSSSELHLHSLSIWGFMQLTWPNIHWESLSHLTLFGVGMRPYELFETVLRRCTNLISLQGDLAVMDDPPQLALGRIEFPCLTLLAMAQFSYFPLFLIRAPQLLHLRIRESGPRYNVDFTEFPLLRTIVFPLTHYRQFLLETCPNLAAVELLAEEPAADILKAFAPDSLEANMMPYPALARIRLRIHQIGIPAFRRTIWTSLERILHQRPHLSLEIEATPRFIDGVKDLFSMFPGRVRVVEDFAEEPPLSDLF